MSNLQSALYETIDKLSDDKILKVLSFAMYLRDEPDYELDLAADDENEIINALLNDERIDSETVEKRFSGQ